jgi:hypothetical protein
VTCAEFAFDE